MSPEQNEANTAAMKDDSKAAEMVADWSEKNIASPLFKNGIVDWAKWNSKYGLEVRVREGSTQVPLREKQFVIRQVAKYGRTEKEAGSLWCQAPSRGRRPVDFAERQDCRLYPGPQNANESVGRYEAGQVWMSGPTWRNYLISALGPDIDEVV